MFTKSQLEFIMASLTAKGTAIPTQDNGEVARLFIATLDEIDAQLSEIESETPVLKSVDAKA
jgi:hypothetical protein